MRCSFCSHVLDGGRRLIPNADRSAWICDVCVADCAERCSQDGGLVGSLDAMWQDQERFMELLVEKRGFPRFPVDLTSKAGQKLIADASHHCADELHEARQHLKNSKSHRVTEIKEIDREAFIEELIDAQHLLFEVFIAAGISRKEMYEAYMKKGVTNYSRILSGY